MSRVSLADVSPCWTGSAARRRWRATAAFVATVAALVISAPPARADRIRDAQWHLEFLQVTQAHQITRGAGVTVAVVDTGVDSDHPDLAGAVVAGRDFAILEADPPDGRTDLDGHGTAMAGLVAARGRGGDGVLGMAPESTILPVRATEDDTGIASDRHTSIEWAATQGADVISMSFGSPERRAHVERAIEAARRADTVLVAAVGNLPEDKVVNYPAAYPGVIAVGGVDRQGNHWPYSPVGPKVDLVAPAVEIGTIRPKGKYHTSYGTSDATAIVAGAAALVRARFPELSADEVAYRLTATAIDKGPKGRDDQYGYGVLNVVGALTADLPPMPADYAEPVATQPPVRRPNVPPPMAQPKESGFSAGVLAIGAGCILLVGAAAVGALLLVRRRRA